MGDKLSLKDNICIELIRDNKDTVTQKCPKCQHSAKKIEIELYQCRAKNCCFKFEIKN